MKTNGKILRAWALATMLVVPALTFSGCGNSLLMPSGLTPPIAERVGTPYRPGDEVPIVFNPATGAYERQPIPGVETPPVVPPPMVTYTGISN